MIKKIKPRPIPKFKVKKNNKKRRIRLFVLIIIIIISASATFFIHLADDALFPAAVEIATINAHVSMNKYINDSVNKVMLESSLESSDFYEKTSDSDGKVNLISADTLLINYISNKISAEISDRLESSGLDTVSVPMGLLLGFDTFANTGPNYTVMVLPKGSLLVEPQCTFDSGGINQINFQVWLNIETTIRIVNPLQHKDITITRKVPIINTVISGDVPSGMIKQY